MVRLNKRYQLLLADDDPGFRETIRWILDPYFRLFEANSGEEALAMSADERFDIALLDMHMHHLTGLETLKALKSINSVAPCILITADVTEELRRDATAAEAFSVLQKPISRLELMTTVSTALEEAYEDPDVFLPFSR